MIFNAINDGEEEVCGLMYFQSQMQNTLENLKIKTVPSSDINEVFFSSLCIKKRIDKGIDY